jgi:SAM-dependent methyltransferase
VRVRRNFEELYRRDSDPWAIGLADSARYDRYFDAVSPYARGVVLDIGCGAGAFLARCQGSAERLVGIEVSATAINTGRERFPKIDFLHGSADRLGEIQALRGLKFDLIICSDLIYYLSDRGKLQLLEWVSKHLQPGGILLLAAWCPGGKYLTAEELIQLGRAYFVILETQVFEASGHVALIVRRRRSLAALTVDYETWHPIPVGKTIDWEADVFAPADRLASIGERCSVPVTFFVEMGEYLWVRDHEPVIARHMEEQWRDLAVRGHDLQLHLHPSWLPELGASKSDGHWFWDSSFSKADAYPGDLTALIGRCKEALESVVKQAVPSHRVTCFRAGAYQAQPFERLYDALTANGIVCDSSVYNGGHSEERGYDYRHAYSYHQPYFASRYDPQLKAPPAEEGLVELPVFTSAPNARCFIDGSEGECFSADFLRYLKHSSRYCGPGRSRFAHRLLAAWTVAYQVIRRAWPGANRLLPRPWLHALTNYRSSARDNDQYFVLIGHTKAELRERAIEQGLKDLRNAGGVEFVAMSSLATHAVTELASRRRQAKEETAFQVKREYNAILGDTRNLQQSLRLQEMIPLDRSAILDFGCGAGYWSERIASLRPWVRVVGVDAGLDFLRRARKRNPNTKVTFCLADFQRLPFPDGSFDCVYADNTLEHSFDVTATLREIRRVLRDGGVLVAALPPDAVRPEKECDSHTWKTSAADVSRRFGLAGFSGIDIEELDVLRKLGAAPYPPADDKMMYVRCWAMRDGYSASARARHAMDWLYRHLSPEISHPGWRVKEILTDGHAFCAGYAAALGQILMHAGYSVRWLSMEAQGHHRGRGPKAVEHHEVISACIDGSWVILDPMANTLIPDCLEAILARPALAPVKSTPDERYVRRGYRYYDTQYWYSRVVRFSYRSSLRTPPLFWKKNKWYSGERTSSIDQATSRVRVGD